MEQEKNLCYTVFTVRTVETSVVHERRELAVDNKPHRPKIRWFPPNWLDANMNELI